MDDEKWLREQEERLKLENEHMRAQLLTLKKRNDALEMTGKGMASMIDDLSKILRQLEISSSGTEPLAKPTLEKLQQSLKLVKLASRKNPRSSDAPVPESQPKKTHLEVNLNDSSEGSTSPDDDDGSIERSSVTEGRPLVGGSAERDCYRSLEMYHPDLWRPDPSSSVSCDDAVNEDSSRYRSLEGAVDFEESLSESWRGCMSAGDVPAEQSTVQFYCSLGHSGEIEANDDDVEPELLSQRRSGCISADSAGDVQVGRQVDVIKQLVALLQQLLKTDGWRNVSRATSMLQQLELLSDKIEQLFVCD
mmetsp:Transcript_67444/g.112142  ORF Transcript_67444/g.112142 Transcript_67444/m.112142 type:complete len:306 (-) Transcript_67444:286-1203(-)